MRARNKLYLILLGIATACSGPVEENVLPPTPAAAMQRVSFRSSGSIDYTVFTFRKNEDGFVFFRSFEATGTTDGKMEIQLPVGSYQFLFASSYGTNTLQQPEAPTAGTTLFSDMHFVTQATGDGKLMNADELFLQDANADWKYEINGPTTIQCTLKRAVAQVILYIKRGKKTGDQTYQPLPYAAGQNIQKYFDQIQLSIEGAGKSVDALSMPSGKGDLSLSYLATACDSITEEGFLKFVGPFFFPPEHGGTVSAHITLVPTGDAPQPSLSMNTQATVGRNEQLIITVWITNDWNFIYVDTENKPMKENIPGEEDVWDNNITQL